MRFYRRPSSPADGDAALLERIAKIDAADVTDLPTAAGFLCLAVVLDAFSRRVVGRSMASHLRTELVLDALEMALGQRQPREVMHHSGQGCRYTSFAFRSRCRRAGVRPSMGSVGDCYDNALCETFFATPECELLDRRRLGARAQVRIAVFQFIEGWDNPRRRHSAIAYLSHVNYERKQLLAFCRFGGRRANPTASQKVESFWFQIC